MTANEIILAIQSSNLTGDECNQISRAIRGQFDAAQRVAQRKFKTGDLVSFTARGQKLSGSVVRILVKNIRVKTITGVEYRVSPSLLSLGA